MSDNLNLNRAMPKRHDEFYEMIENEWLATRLEDKK